jgi:pimeloyl-ACP methyl ester carboxylesterase
VAIALDERGEGDPLVLLHGVGTSRVIWRRALPHLGARRRALALDVPGFGDSPAIGDGFSLDATAEEIAEEMSRRLDGSFDLLGNSLGGAIALVLAHRRPDAVRRLVLLAPAGFAPRPGPIAALAGGGSAVLLALRRGIGTPLAGNSEARRVLLAGALHDGRRVTPEDARLMLEAPGRATRLRSAMSAAVACDLRPVLAALEVPVGLIWGERDRVVPPATLDAILALSPGAPSELIPDAGHAAQMERPLEFSAALERLLRRLGPKG